ncbi:hypothetical protein K2Z83_12375 [Oscillochloris sp. ZM17-4]|uniref:hypothetical protein n=1 Tax=Oscillochloris sp. ZM17-4 TaxID=2866714 RepID=UPI001C72AAFC|nr:hypothetical protein [Oscillochloris sp. ZM17-4]MBX0328473.1 hypothetical protein [Oscillochloris sp. ZM17-4]
METDRASSWRNLRRDTMILCVAVTAAATALFFWIDRRLPDWAGHTWAPLAVHSALVLAAGLVIRELICLPHDRRAE